MRPRWGWGAIGGALAVLVLVAPSVITGLRLQASQQSFYWAAFGTGLLIAIPVGMMAGLLCVAIARALPRGLRATRVRLALTLTALGALASLGVYVALRGSFGYGAGAWFAAATAGAALAAVMVSRTAEVADGAQTPGHVRTSVSE